MEAARHPAVRNMSDAKRTVDWRAWFATEEANLTINRLKTTQQIRPPDVADLGQDTIHELTSIKRPEKQKLNESELHEYLGSLTLQDLQSHVSAHASVLESAQAEWHQKRNTGWRKSRTGAQDFAVTFDQFLKSFSGIVEIAKMADECYGGAATTIMSLFYATVKIKADNDEAILSAMQTLADRLPDAKIYGQIYADHILAMKLAEAYRDVLIFAKTATAYFQGRGISRTLTSIRNPVKFPDMSESLARDFTGIRIRAEALLSQRVAYLAVQNMELLRQVKLLTDGQNNDRVRRMQKLLDRRQSDSKKVRDDRLSESRHFLSLVSKQSPRELSQMSLQGLQWLSEYHKWAKAGSSLLFLHGCNHGNETMPQSWLSLAVVDLITHLQQEPRASRLVAYEMCSPEHTITDVLKSLILQLLELQPAVLSEADDEREIELRISRNQDGIRASEDFKQLPLGDYSWALRRIIERCDSPVHLVISRPESCQGDDLWDLIKHLLALVRDSANTVKILMLVRTELWSIEERLLDIDRGILDSSQLVVSRQDQPEWEDQGY
ncbi:hypothetical protein B0T25DRAFT_572089 [Lasiosphaeria hispida]|uniref:DUF7708 domain-containing protein n=1 Tax=Lasiosphaeria hispida TaxID=260671 RepID=A0AAJ0MB81_9PEZI|nr:hypothetical protein B0T25DRAFT_572089 [Lasiosphaeria hispida]